MSLKLKLLILGFSCLSSFALKEKNYFNAKTLEKPTREISIIITPTGYYPSRPIAFVGERVKLFVTSTTDQPTCLILKNRDVFLEAKKGQVTEAEVFVEHEGEIEMYCPAGGHKSKLVVLEHPNSKSERISREIAQERAKNLKIWRPKDE